jgi:hypothetical protein
MYCTSISLSSKIEVAYKEAIALKRQEELIREEEETSKRSKVLKKGFGKCRLN